MNAIPAPEAYIATQMDAFGRALKAYPAGFAGNPLNLLFLDGARPIAHALAYLRALDAPAPHPDRREYLHRQLGGWPFPTVTVTARPDPWAVSHALFAHFDLACGVLNRQEDIGAILAARAEENVPDIVALMVVDGLSYYDLPANTGALPCLVTGPTITPYGYRRVIGDPPVGKLLFDRGYHEQIGLTYFDPSGNALAGDLFSLFGKSRVHRMPAIAAGMDWLSGQSLTRAFVQVTAMGLDQFSHSHRDRPPRDRYLTDTLAAFTALVDCLRAGGKRVLACLTADHGILWRDVFDAHPPEYAELNEATAHPRYLAHAIMRPYGLVRTTTAGTSTLLRVPYLTRAMRVNEWGVHGGVSAWESIVPLIVLEEG